MKRLPVSAKGALVLKLAVVILAAGKGQAIASCTLNPIMQKTTEPTLSTVVLSEVIAIIKAVLLA